MFSYSYFFTIFPFLSFCFGLSQFVLRTYEETLWLHKMRKEFFSLRRCTSLQVTELNFEDAYLYLKESSSEEIWNELYQARVHFSSLLLSYKICPEFSSLKIKAFPHKEENRGLPLFWPNWVIRFH